MLRQTLVEVIKSTIMIEEKMLVRIKNITRYYQESDNEKSEDSNEEEKWRPKKKEPKDHSEIIRRSVYCKNCCNEGHLTKECNLLNKFAKWSKLVRQWLEELE